MGRLTEIKLANEPTDAVPDGWLTTAEWAEEEGKSIPQTNKLIRELMRGGHMETRTFTIRTGSRVMPVPHYRLVPDKKK